MVRVVPTSAPLLGNKRVVGFMAGSSLFDTKSYFLRNVGSLLDLANTAIQACEDVNEKAKRMLSQRNNVKDGATRLNTLKKHFGKM